MATRRQCELALRQLASWLDQVDPEVRRRRVPARTVSLLVPDLDLAYRGVLDADGLREVVPVPPVQAMSAQVRFRADSDEVVNIGRRPAAFVPALAQGRVRVHAGLRDLLELRRFVM